MTLALARLNRERRVSSFEPTKVNLQSPGVRRILEITARNLRSHDTYFKKKDERRWQTKYSLLRHHEMDMQVVSLMCRDQRLSEFETFLCELAAQVHDMGKVDKECWVYRLNRRLSSMEKMAVDTHGARTANYLRKMRRHMRSEDYALIDLLLPVASHHHKPFLIRDPGLRQIGFNLKFADIFVSLTEDRDRPGMPVYLAVERIKEEVKFLMSDPSYAVFASQIDRSARTLVNLFG